MSATNGTRERRPTDTVETVCARTRRYPPISEANSAGRTVATVGVQAASGPRQRNPARRGVRHGSAPVPSSGTSDVGQRGDPWRQRGQSCLQNLPHTPDEIGDTGGHGGRGLSAPPRLSSLGVVRDRGNERNASNGRGRMYNRHQARTAKWKSWVNTLMVEQLHPGVSARNARVCLFDFDGTISLIRSGWMGVMIPMMVEILADPVEGTRE